MEVNELTRRLIDIPSITGEEAELGRFLIHFLKELGYQVESQKVDAGRSNILARTDSPPRIVFSSHYDTVPPFIPSGEDSEFVYGRGACDAKGIIAAQIMAAEELRSRGVSRIGLLFVIDEELGSSGARAANLHPLASECRYLINGEPTENKLAIGSKGSLRAAIITDGRAAHSAYPEAGESAIEKLLDILADIRGSRWPRDEFFGETTCNIGLISGGMRPNIIPAEARADLHIRLVTDAARLKVVLTQTVGGRGRIEFLSETEPVRMVAMKGFDSCVVRYTTDVPHLGNWGEPLLLGPGSILDAHTAHERVSKRELAEAVELYVRLVHDLLAKTKDS